jgi:BMFP domain-containing protein YqiC
MADDRNEQRAPQSGSLPLLALETLRSASSPPEAAPPVKEERISVFWRIFGGTLLSIGALVVLSLCQYFNNSLNALRGDLARLSEDVHKEIGHLCADLRKDLVRLTENQADLVKKEEYGTRLKSIWDSLKELQALGTTVAALKERSLLQDQQMREETDRKELVRELQQLRERLANLEGRQAASPPGKPAVAGDN